MSNFDIDRTIYGLKRILSNRLTYIHRDNGETSILIQFYGKIIRYQFCFTYLPDISLRSKQAVEKSFRWHPADGQHRFAAFSVVFRPDNDHTCILIILSQQSIRYFDLPHPLCHTHSRPPLTSRLSVLTYDVFTFYYLLILLEQHFDIAGIRRAMMWRIYFIF